ncbi:DUF2938 domain-containing protein [Kordiimonas aestuarii]|uniref:DUF2938 domain-containing protein n=1 Tax=Kordiimonas aestuarii TaxID=1005925 RepID=UPI0021CEEF15|nr:DUF2938 domain-containing protein [Kordiimonas aestuarii]
MDNLLEFLGYTLAIGIGATVVMDLWAVFIRRFFGIHGLNYAMLGRWIGHMTRGRVRHQSIADAAPVYNEAPVGWAIHYATGIAFAAILLLVVGAAWVKSPTLLPALATGVGSVIAPYFIMQPALGLGVAACRTPAPNAARLKSLTSHTVFGIGLYLAAQLLAVF